MHLKHSKTEGIELIILRLKAQPFAIEQTAIAKCLADKCKILRSAVPPGDHLRIVALLRLV